MNRLSARDYKKTTRRSVDLGRYREFGSGLLVGVVLAAGAFVYLRGEEPATVQDKPHPEPRRTEAAAPPAAEAAESSERYDFYEMLPNFEVVVPEKDREVKRDLSPASKVERPGVYVLQAGSYRKLPDAERVRKQLALQGMDAKVQRVAVDNDVWHRVRIGPIGDLAELNKLRKQLQAAEMDALVIRVGD